MTTGRRRRALTSISLTPPSATIEAGATQQFIATGHFSDGSTAAVSVDWTATGGTVNNGGLYTAGTTGGSFAVTATAHGSTMAQSATVTVTSTTPVLATIVVTPDPITVATGGTQQFTATGHFTGGGTGSVTVDWTATGGTVNSSGLYTAGTTAGDFVVTATEHGGSIAGTAAVTLSVAPPTLTSITVAPTPVTIASSTTKQFAATGHFSDGSTGGVAVTWTATGGTVDATGLYTAGTTDGNYQVTATSTSSAIAGHADVTISTAPPNLVAIEVSPTNVRIKPYDSLRFSAIGRLSDGGTMAVAVTWSTTTLPSGVAMNSIRADGEFRAGVPIGGFVVTATLQGGTLSGTAAGTVHETAGKTVGGPPLFWAPVAGAVYLCTSNHFTDDGEAGWRRDHLRCERSRRAFDASLHNYQCAAGGSGWHRLGCGAMLASLAGTQRDGGH